MAKGRTLILNSRQVGQKITRMAHEIYEKNYLSEELVIVGITGRGFEIARRLSAQLKKISPLSISTRELQINKDEPLREQITISGKGDIRGKDVILVDDVLNSGRTLVYATAHLLGHEPRSLATATLVDRFHLRFPIRADFVGLTLSTNLKEHITVLMGGEDEGVYLE